MKKNSKLKELGQDGFFSIITAFLFAVYNGCIGIAKNYYFGFSIAVYYFLLCAVRALSYAALRKERENPSENADRYYVASVVLLLLVNIFLIGPIVLMVFQKREVNLGSVSAISVATYTTVKIILAVKNYRKTAKQTVRQACTRRAVNLVDAIVSLLTLQNTLIATNGGATSNEMRLLSAVSGVIAFVLIMIISAESFVHIKKTLKND